ncbi:putative Signal transduction histidine kinase [Burkholderiales bacterium]|nr:putative Signal transduction histidine kinase [Burkholderiales bacterium]
MQERPSLPPSAARRPALVLRIGQALLVAAALLFGAMATASAVPIRKLEWSYIAPDPLATTQQSTGESRTPFDLPLRWSSVEGSPLHTVAMRMHFQLSAVPDRTWAVLLSHTSEGGRFSVNGHFIGAIAAESATRHVSWRRPQLLAIDAPMLVEGDNELLIETSYGPGSHALAGIEVGPMSELWNQYALQFVLEYVWTWIGATIALLTALVFGALWWRRREAISKLLALAALCWIVYCAAWLVEIIPPEYRLWVRLAGMTAMAAFSATLAVTLMRLSSLSRRREEWLIWAYAALGPVLSLASSMGADPYLSLSWQPGLILIIAIAAGVGLYRRTQGLVAPHPLVLIAAVILLLAALIDFGSVARLINFEGTPAMNFAGPLMLAALATPLVDGFIKILREAEAARAELETRVREREQLLKRNFERLRASERVTVEAQERQRIMQDMHDGLGSQLMSSLMLVERGAVSNEQFAQILRESIDDMRLAIDALAAEDADLAAALGNLRFRMEPRLRAAGMELTWDARRLPEEIGLHPDVVLPILRIVQEALTNALKHSRARAVRVTLAVEGSGEAQSLDIRVADNGRGIAEERVGGRGLLNMRNRAQKIGAQLKLETAPNVGTTVHLRARIGPISPSTRPQQTVLNTQAIIERARQQ